MSGLTRKPPVNPQAEPTARAARGSPTGASNALGAWLRHPLLLAAQAIVRSVPARWATLLQTPIESILHPSPRRLKLLGAFTLIGHPLFYWIWHDLLPQPYENLGARLAMAALGIPLLLDGVAQRPQSTRTQRIYNLICFIQLPVFFCWMYAMNGYNGVWLASVAAMVVIYFHLTDWRIAAVASIAGFALGTTLGEWQAIALEGHALMPLPVASSATVVLAFAWFAGLMLGLSGANLRRERLEHALATIGIMAHELRTPLSTAALIGDALRQESARQSDPARAAQLDKLAQRLLALVRSMNHHIDLQIANARLLQLPNYADLLSAQALVTEAVIAYPYRTQRERECVEVVIHGDFSFRGSHAQFLRVIDNLLQNALRSLQVASSVLSKGDIRIEVGHRGREGRISVSDRGIGIDAAAQARIFEPFFSSDGGTGHGLGLAFCRRVLQASGGSIRVKSAPAKGATFTLVLPVEHDNPVDTPTQPPRP